MESTNNTPFKLPLWSDWTVQIKEKHKLCLSCNSTIASLKVLAIESLFNYLKETNKFHDLARILQSNLIPPILFVDIACQLFAQKQWSVLRSLISHWPFEVFQLSNVISSTCCSPCWLTYLETDDVDDPEKEGGDTERQLLRKVFKHVLDGYFFVVKGTLDNEGTKSPLRTLDLTLDSSHNIRGFLWEDEFRRLGRRVTKTLDVCVLAGLHKKVRAKQLQLMVCQQQQQYTTTLHWDSNPEAIGYWSPEQFQHPELAAEIKEVEPTFEISTWGKEELKITPTEALSKSPEIGVWNGNAIDLSHLTEMPIFTIIIDTCISEKSTDILTWIQQRYDDFAPLPSPVSVSVRFLEVALHEERKFDALFSRLPEYIQGFQLSEICERRSAQILASNLSRFSNIRFLDLGSCAFDLADQPQTVECMSFAMSQLPRLERLSLAHNYLSGCLSQLLSPLQQGLKLLDLSSCSLCDDDLDYLAESTHRNTLRSLSLASNELAVHWDRLLMLTEKLGGGSSLRILDLSSNDFVESQLSILARCTLGPLASLYLLDLSWHQLPLSQLVYIIELLAEKTLLRTFCLSTPVDMAECGYDQPESWQMFVDFTTALTTKHRSRHGRSPLTLHWCLM